MSGFRDGDKCFFKCSTIGNNKIELPCYPEEITESLSATFSKVSPIGRSTPIVSYISTSAPSVGFSLILHAEMLDSMSAYNGSSDIFDILKKLKATEYPKYNAQNGSNFGLTPPITTFGFGEIKYRGVVDSVGITYKKPLLETSNKQKIYSNYVVTISMSVIAPNVIDSSDIVGKSAFRSFMSN